MPRATVRLTRRANTGRREASCGTSSPGLPLGATSTRHGDRRREVSHLVWLAHVIDPSRSWPRLPPKTKQGAASQSRPPPPGTLPRDGPAGVKLPA